MGTTTNRATAFDDTPARPAPAAFRKVLVVDDDPAMRRIVGKILSSAGYSVRHAANGFEAIEAMRQHLPHFVITDWDMPVLDGAEFCRAVRGQNLPHYVYIVMLTGTRRDDLVQGLRSGADDFLAKPVRAPELLARMQAGARVLKLEEQLRLLADQDPLTGVLNRRAFFEFLDLEWARADRMGYPLSCVMIDVDHFKKINDTHGHPVGDAALKSIARRLQQACRKTDALGRYGGEEFSVLLPGTDEQQGVCWAERCRAAVAQTPLLAGEIRIQVTVSVGVAQRSHVTGSPEQLLDLTDQALLTAKRQGRNRVVASASLEGGRAPGIVAEQETDHG